MCNQVDDLKSSLAKCIFKEKNKILKHIFPNQQLNFKADRMQESFCTSGFLSLPLFIFICFLTNKTIVQFTSNKMQRSKFSVCLISVYIWSLLYFA
ncbi:hypothetical protein T01_3851 [Trichinella spiralis]|uniref:Uncharacterized protein n=1 Tax=Trichinella spiralis TaxID=6334 RepID=A0A0V1B9L9_TRISP|nr:hypothetical protein T01_3851 [Trichinella spiralis]